MPTATKPIAVSPEIVTRFWAKVNGKDAVQCWLWTGNRVRGYGQLALAHNVQVYAHRLSWVIANGPIPNNQSVLHHCDTPACVNPNHLFLGTQADNLADASRKGRLTVPRVKKLTLAQRLAIFFSAERGVELARRHGVSKALITVTRQGRFVGAPAFQRIEASAQARADFNQLAEQARHAGVVGHGASTVAGLRVPALPNSVLRTAR